VLRSEIEDLLHPRAAERPAVTRCREGSQARCGSFPKFANLRVWSHADNAVESDEGVQSMAALSGGALKVDTVKNGTAAVAARGEACDDII